MKSVRVAAVVAGIAASAAACGTSSGTAVLGQPTNAALERPAVTSVRASTHTIVVKTRSKAPFGTILTTARGHSLYLYSRDTKGHSHCGGGCLQDWPALIVPKGYTLTGVSGLGTITRPNGKHQAALHGKPLYTFVGDSAAGEVSGQGIEGTWWVATPSGASHVNPNPTPTTSSPSPSPSQTSGGGGGGGGGGYGY